MSNWKYTDATNRVVTRTNSDGSTESCLVSVIADWLSEGNTPTPADQLPNPRIAEIQQRLTQIDQESIRAMRSKQLARGKTQDDTKLTALDDEADALRLELSTL